MTLRDVTKDQIIEIAEEVGDRFHDLANHEIFNLVGDCIGRELTEVEERLVIVAFENDAETAKRSIWYT